MLHVVNALAAFPLNEGVTLEKYAEAMRTLEASGWETDGGSLLCFFNIVMEPKVALVETEYREGWGVKLEAHLPDSVRPSLVRYDGVPPLPGHDMWVYVNARRHESYIISKERGEKIVEQMKLAESVLREHQIIQ